MPALEAATALFSRSASFTASRKESESWASRGAATIKRTEVLIVSDLNDYLYLEMQRPQFRDSYPTSFSSADSYSLNRPQLRGPHGWMCR